MTTRQMIDLVCDEKIVEKDYMPLPSESLSADVWKMDCADFLLNLSDDDLVELRERLKKVLWWEKYMMHGNQPHHTVDYVGTVVNDSMSIVSLLLKSLSDSNITIKMLAVEDA